MVGGNNAMPDWLKYLCIVHTHLSLQAPFWGSTFLQRSLGKRQVASWTSNLTITDKEKHKYSVYAFFIVFFILKGCIKDYMYYLRGIPFKTVINSTL